MTFSERMGFKPVKVAIQTADMDDDLRVALWNFVQPLVQTASNTRTIRAAS